MHVTPLSAGQSIRQDTDSVMSPMDRLAELMERKPETKPQPGQETKPLPKVDLVGDWVKKLMRDQLWAMIYGADEEETGIPRLEMEL